MPRYAIKTSKGRRIHELAATDLAQLRSGDYPTLCGKTIPKFVSRVNSRNQRYITEIKDGYMPSCPGCVAKALQAGPQGRLRLIEADGEMNILVDSSVVAQADLTRAGLWAVGLWHVENDMDPFEDTRDSRSAARRLLVELAQRRLHSVQWSERVGASSSRA
jgi:hypothetical protein